MDITKTRIHYVYGLHYPDGKLFYVGKGKGRRMYDHAPAARAKRCPNKHLQYTILGIERNGGSIWYKKFFVGLSEDEANAKERCLICLFGKRHDGTGFLVNIANGGEGSAGHKMPMSQRQILSERMKGKPGLRRGKTHTEAARAKIRTARANQVSPMKGRKHSQETKDKISQAKTGIPSGRKGIPRQDGHIKKMNDKWRGSKQTPEVIEKIRESSKARWQDPVYVEKVLAARAAARSMKKMEASCQ